MLKANRERDRDLVSRRTEQSRQDSEELIAVRSKLRDAEILADDRSSELDDMRRRCCSRLAACLPRCSVSPHLNYMPYARIVIIQDQFDKEKQRLQERIHTLEAQIARADSTIAALQSEAAASHAAPTRSAAAGTPAHSSKSKPFVASGSSPASSGPVGSVVASSTGGGALV